MDLSGIEELAVQPVAPDRVRLRWRIDGGWESYEYLDEDSGDADDEDVMFWLLRHSAPVDLVRQAMSAHYPDFDVNVVLEFVTMPDRAERRAADVAHRESLKAAFRTRRSRP